MLNKILLATNNPHKQEKLRWILDRYFKQIDLPKTSLDIEEEGDSFEEIAKKKALEASINYNGFSIATDGGMEIPALGNSWDALFTKRFVGKENVTDFDRMDALLELMKDKKDRRMRWEEAVAIAYKGRVVFSASAEGAKGVLQTHYDKSKYKNGIWLCSLWYFPTYKKNYFDLKPREMGFAEVSWFRLKSKVEYYLSVPYTIRLEQKRAISNLRLKKAYTLENWPHDPLTEVIKGKTLPLINSSGTLLDKNDLKYQVLFRITTYQAKEVFNQTLEDYLRKTGIYDSWLNIPKLERNYLRRFKINEELVKDIVGEQIKVIEKRLKDSTLPLEDILKPKNEIFKTKGWVIVRKNGFIYAVKKGKKVELEFKKVDKDYAKKLHDELHYIHFSRVEEAFGLFIKSEKLPFSVLAIEKIDREYKKKAVLLKGFDYSKVVDFTRLYSFAGSPMNTSSVMFALTRNYLRKNTDVQASISAFMPSYANGMSMYAGGLDTVLVAKPLKLIFAKLSQGNLYQHIVNRAKEQYGGGLIYSKIPLLPTLELLAPITKPPLIPDKRLDGRMVVLDGYE